MIYTIRRDELARRADSPTHFLSSKEPPDDLAREVQSIWTGSTKGLHAALPDSGVDIVWIEPTELSLSLSTAAVNFWRPPGRAIAGLSLKPGAARRVLGDVALSDVGGAGSRPLGEVAPHLSAEIERSLARACDPIDGLVEGIRPAVLGARSPEWFESALAAALTAPESPSIERLAADLAMSVRQLHRTTTAAFGFAPTTVVRINRLLRFLRGAAVRSTKTLAEVATVAGYYDHPHLCRDARSIAGLSPSDLVEQFSSAAALIPGPTSEQPTACD